MIRLRRGRRRASLLEMTPLVDVVFLLLIFFLLTSTSMQHSMDVQLPRTRSGTAGAVEPVRITIPVEGPVRLNRQPIPLERLGPALRERLRAAPRRGVTIAADRGVAFGRFTRALDLARQAGAGKIRLATGVVPGSSGP